MALTRDFKETVQKRVDSDPEFAKALFREALDLMLDGDAETSRLILRDLVNATVGFERLALEMQKSSKSLHRMLSLSGNPTMGNLSEMFAALKKTTGLTLQPIVEPEAQTDFERSFSSVSKGVPSLPG